MAPIPKNQAMTSQQEQWTMVSSDDLHEEAAELGH